MAQNVYIFLIYKEENKTNTGNIKKNSISGTNGGISFVGTLASLVGGLIVGTAFYITLVLLANENYLVSSPPQWPLILIGGLLGVIGSMVDSFLGATVQYSGLLFCVKFLLTYIVFQLHQFLVETGLLK